MGKIKLDANLRDKLRYLYLYISKLNRVEQHFISFGYDLKNDILSHIHLSRAITSQLIHLILNEEIANFNHHANIFELFDQLGAGEDKEDINSIFINNPYLDEYTKDLFVDGFNMVLQNSFVDYLISMWSSFELSISHIYKKYELESTTILHESHLKNLTKFIKNKILSEIDLNDSDKTKITELIYTKKSEFLKVFPKYVSSEDQINFIFKQIESRYPRNVEEDKKTIRFIRSLRNTMHNNGIHLAKDSEVVIKGEKFEIKKNTEAHLQNHINFVKLYIELLEIYTYIISALPYEDTE